MSRATALLALGTALAGCGAKAKAADSPSCPALTQVASRVYGQVAHGRDTVGAVARVERSRALADAVARADPAATRAALKPLLRADIRRIVVLRRSRVLASFGRAAGLAPVRGTLRDAAGAPVGRFVLATGTVGGLEGLLSQITGARVTINPGAGSIPATAFPSGARHIALHVPAGACGATSTDTIGEVGERLFQAETSGPQARHVLRLVAANPRFARAVADRDPAALRAQIVRFFGDPHLHVVRIRAADEHGRLIGDVGGPFVLAPASTTVRLHGRAVGTVTLSVQDDTGYIKLMQRFTGAEVVLRTATGAVVPGSSPVPPGPHHEFSFTAAAFPTGPLRVTLVVSAMN